MFSGCKVSKAVFSDRRLKSTAGSQYQCHSRSVCVPLGADQALEGSWLPMCNCYCAVDLFTVVTLRLCR